MAKTKLEIMLPDGMASLSEKEHLELLECIAQRMEKAERKFKQTDDDHDMADLFELQLLYHTIDVDPKRSKAMTRDLAKLPGIIAEIRATPRVPCLRIVKPKAAKKMVRRVARRSC